MGPAIMDAGVSSKTAGLLVSMGPVIMNAGVSSKTAGLLVSMSPVIIDVLSAPRQLVYR